MQITQSYAKPSAATIRPDGMEFSLSTEAHRPIVALQAMVSDSLAYARVMLALHEVVSSDLRFAEKDHTAYQEWVQARYLEELDDVMGDRLRALPAQQEELAQLKEKVAPLKKRERELWGKIEGGDLWKAKGRYWKWLLVHNKALWWILDPVVSVHPDATIFEVFSRDESSYARVTVPASKLQTMGETIYGTTNVDFSARLADELRRVRDYRPAFLGVGGEGVSIQTTAGQQFEKKIDLPPSWVRGFLQVQSAASLPGVEVTVSSGTVAEILLALRKQREKASPRSLRFHLVPGEKPRIEIEPWNVVIQEQEYCFAGESAEEIRVWGRRRLFSLETLLPHAEQVKVKLLGTGMPSYWSVECKEHRFDLGLSGWTENDWSAAARFDLLASTKEVSAGDIEVAASRLEKALKITPPELTDISDLSRESAASALQALCREGRAMFDIVSGEYRWRKLLAFPVPASPEDKKLASARRWIGEGNVKCEELKPAQITEFLQRHAQSGARLFGARVKTEGGVFEPTVGLNEDGRATFAQCTCGEFKRDKLRRGPCAHILATSALASQKLEVGSGDAELFKGET